MSKTLDPFAPFRHTTQARIGLGRVGDALPTRALLELRIAHAEAREAVHRRVDFDQICRQLSQLDPIVVCSQAEDRSTYLRRPDLGRRLEPNSLEELEGMAGPYDLAVVVGDGLSASAVAAHAVPLVLGIYSQLADLALGPVVLAEQARVALGDEIGHVLGAEIVAMIVGERPGLSVSNSLGIYVTFEPKVGRNDAERNCISNVHEGGASIEEAVRQLGALVREAKRLKLTGVNLKVDPSHQLAGDRAVLGATDDE